MPDLQLNQTNNVADPTAMIAAAASFGTGETILAVGERRFASDPPSPAGPNLIAVHGQVAGAEGIGLLGRSPGIGVLGDNSRPTPAGDLVQASAKQVGVKGTGFVGVRGEGLGTGVWGEATFNGVVGRASGNAGKGIDGFSGGAAGVGVAGECATAIGVRGRGRVGVMGESLTTQGSGVRGEGAIGIVGATKGTNSTAMFADATKGGEALLAFSPDGTAVSATSNGVAGFFYGNVIVVGNLQVTGGLAVTGTKSATVECSDGRQRALYAIEAPESWFEDVGEAQLRSGRAEVPLARDFAGVIRTARYQVFLTPYGEVRGLFVARRTRHGFTVAELGGGSSSARFAYRIVARRRDVSASRMPVVSSKAPSRPDLREHLQRLRRMSSASGSKKRRDAKSQGASRRPPLAGTPASPTRGAGLSPRRRAVAGAQ